MASITTRSGKGSALTHVEVDGNFTNLNTDKLDVAGIAAGSASSPTVKFTGSTGTGIYSPAANTVAISTDTTERLRINSAGNVGIGTTSPARTFDVNGTVRVADGSAVEWGGTSTYIAGTSAQNALLFYTGSSERFRCDSSGRLLVGTSSAPTFNASTAPLNVAHGNVHAASFIRYSANEFGPFVGIGKSRTDAIGSHTAVTNGDTLGIISFFGSNGTDFSNQAANIIAQVDAEPFTSGDTTDLPGRLVFSTTADGASSPTERMRITSNGNLLFGGTASPTSAAKAFCIFNGTAPTASVADGVVLYAEDVSSSSELKVRDEAGNVTTLSPHNFDLIPEGPSEEMAWSYYSERDGKRINVDMLKAIRLLEQLSGQKLVYSS